MKDFFRFGLVLALICFVSAALLAAVNNATEEVILERKLSEERQALKELFTDASDFLPIESDTKAVYLALDKNNNTLGYAFKSEAKGYAGIISTLVAIDMDDNIKQIKILSQNETPGIGTKITKPGFLNKFVGINLSQDLPVDTISGATISSSALISSIEKSADEVKELVNKRIK